MKDIIYINGVKYYSSPKYCEVYSTNRNVVNVKKNFQKRKMPELMSNYKIINNRLYIKADFNLEAQREELSHQLYELYYKCSEYFSSDYKMAKYFSHILDVCFINLHQRFLSGHFKFKSLKHKEFLLKLKKEMQNFLNERGKNENN